MKQNHSLEDVLNEIASLSREAILHEREAAIRFLSEGEIEEAEQMRSFFDPDQLSFDKKYASPSTPIEPHHPNRLRIIP